MPEQIKIETKLKILFNLNYFSRGELKDILTSTNGKSVSPKTTYVWFARDDLPKKYIENFCKSFNLPEEIFDEVTPNDANEIEKLVKKFRQNQSTKKIDIKTLNNQLIFYTGQTVKIFLTSALDKEFYLYILNIDSENKVTLLFPSGKDNNLIQPHLKYTFPNETGFVVEPPYGEDRLKFILSDRPLESIETKYKTKGLYNPVIKESNFVILEKEKDLLARIRNEAYSRDLEIIEEYLIITTKDKT
jgi:hypothetical protein